MKTREVVRSSALMLGRTDVVKYLDGESTIVTDTLETVNLLTNLCSLVVDELSATYIPLIRKETVGFANGKYSLIQFRDKIVKIIAVYGADGKKVDFSVDEYYVFANVSECVVEYHYSPKNYDLEDEIGYSNKEVSVTALAYGVTAEYCITQGQFEQAVMHHKRYVDAIAEICLPKNRKIKARSWD